MTDIIYSNDRWKTSIEASGHSGYAERGQDIVCSAVSILFIATAGALEKEDFGGNVETDVREGYARIEAEFSYRRQAIFNVAREGFRYLAEEYPEYVTYTEKTTTE